MRSSATFTRARSRRRSRLPWPLTRLLSVLAGTLALALALGLLFAGSPAKLAEGVRIAGIDVGGMTPRQAQRLLERRAKALVETPVTFTEGTTLFRVRPSQLGVQVDWRAAVDSARREGEGFGPVRGFRRLKFRLFPSDLAPPTRAYDAALEYKVALLARTIDRQPEDAAVVRHGLKLAILPGRTGRALDRDTAEETIVRALAAFDRKHRIALPVLLTPQRVTAVTLRPVLQQARRALSAPVRLELGETRWLVPRWRIAQLLELPRAGRKTLRIGGPAAEQWFRSLAARVEQPPQDARFVVSGNRVGILPSTSGRGLDVAASTRALLAALAMPAPRSATLVVSTTQPKRTTQIAQTMGVKSIVSSYTTLYGGTANRVHNVQLVAHLVDGALIPPGKEFSFNATTGERNAAKGFLTAPVIINGELQTGLGGGVCQVSTTVFNSAYELGLPISARTNHALYISHYPLGRDATVNYPDVDLRFRNDTGHWLLLRTFVGSSSLTVNLYGTPVHRRIESETFPLVAVKAAPVKKSVDQTLKPGELVVDDSGVPYQRTQVRRRVYAPNGELLYDSTFYSSYVAEPRVVRVGPKKPKKTKPTKVDAVRPG